MIKRISLSLSLAATTILCIDIIAIPVSAQNDVQVDIPGNLWRGASSIDLNSINENASNQPFLPHIGQPQAEIPGMATNSGIYAALGDSIAAGLGLRDSGSQCGRSTEAYPYLVADTLDHPLLHAACSGATAGDLSTQQDVNGSHIPSQLNAAFASGTPTLITITAGANDAHWTSFLYKCYSGECGTALDTFATNTLLSTTKVKLDQAFSKIQKRSNGTPPMVIVTGYYNPISAQCANLQSQVTRDEIKWLNSQVKTLNQAIKDTAARFSFAKFVPLNFNGHDLCSSDPWVQGLNDPTPLHPTQAGQTAIARTIINSL